MADNTPVKYNTSKKSQILNLVAQMKLERTQFDALYRDICDHINPTRARFTVTDQNKPNRSNNKILDNTGTLASRTLMAGMMSGITSPSRPWFRLTVPDPKLAEFGPVKTWLHDVQQIMMTSFLRSNLYRVLPNMYQDLGDLGTAPFSIEEDFTGDVQVFDSYAVGQYWIACDDKGQVNTFVREFRMTVDQLIRKFGGINEQGEVTQWNVFSEQVKDLWKTGNTQAWINITHIVKPNDDYDNKKLLAKYKRFYSCYYESGTSSNSSTAPYFDVKQELYLRESGYEEFPIMCPRWKVTSGDIYGTSCPGMEARGDIRQLQLGERKTLEAIDKLIDPPTIQPTAMRGRESSLIPGGKIYVDEREGMQGIRPAYQIQFDVNAMEMKQQQVRDRVRRAYYEDLFLMLANMNKSGVTAREIEERHEEKLLALGPVLEQVNDDALDPLIANSFALHLKQGLIPPPPPEIQGQVLKVEYISIMANAQKMMGIASHDRFIGFIGQAMQFFPTISDKIDSDQLADVYADMLSVNPSVIRTDDATAEFREAQQRAIQQSQRAEQMATSARAAKDLSQTSLEGDTALSAMLANAQTGQA